MAGPKADKLTKERRVEAVYRLILDGWTTEQIFQNTSEWGVTERQRRNYINEAEQRIMAIAAPEKAMHLARHIAARRQLARESKHVRDKLAVLKDEAALLGLYPATRHELGGPDGGPVLIQMTWGDVDAGDGGNDAA